MTSLSQSLTTVTISDINIVNATQVRSHSATCGKLTAIQGSQQTVLHSMASSSMPHGH